MKPSLTGYRKNKLGQLGQLESDCTRSARAKESFRKSRSTVPNCPTDRVWDVTAIDRVVGVGRSLGQVQAETLRVAEVRARELFGVGVLVSPAGGKPRRRRQEQRR